MKIVHVIHGYPMRYNAGSEVYTQTLCHALAERGHELHVFTREEDVLAPEFAVRRETDPQDPRIALHVVNNPQSRERYRNPGIDRRFAELLESVGPDVVHIGHLIHLSTSLVGEIHARRIPIVCTLHDYWLMCPRGQFMQMHPTALDDPWPVCHGQEDRKCAERCYARYFSGASAEQEEDVAYWTGWVSRRMTHFREFAALIDVFVAPSRYLRRRFRDGFGIPEDRLVYLDYGFERERLRGRARVPGEPFTFGYIGTHIPAKGIHHLIEAFGRVPGDARLRIWGRSRPETESLKAMARRLPPETGARIQWMPEYQNQHIIPDVLDRVDAVVVPSIWMENSPLVIHEAQQARVPVITADVGGMAEYVHHEVNGLVFEHRNPMDLSVQMQRLADDPDFARRLGARGYVQSDTGDVTGIDEHVRAVEAIYARALGM